MIYYLVTRRHSYTMRHYLGSWGRPLAKRIEVLPYEDLHAVGGLAAGTYVFSDVDRLTPARRQVAQRAWECVSSAPTSHRALNRPGRIPTRLEMLQIFHREGLSTYRAGRASDRGESYRYPVFLRHPGHRPGSIGDLIHTPAELDDATARAKGKGADLDELLVVEFCQTSDGEGIHRKYSSFIIGERVVPRHVLFSRGWVIKMPDLLDEGKLEEEAEYLRRNPHEDWLRRVCATTGTSFGRVDYGLTPEGPQVWEVNLNPRLMAPRRLYREENLPAQRYVAGQLHAAWEALDTPPLQGPAVAFSIEPSLAADAEAEASGDEAREDQERVAEYGLAGASGAGNR